MRRTIVVALLAVVAGCVSPEAKRARTGGAGADVGNRGVFVHLHGGSLMYAGTPCLLPKFECPGPLAVSGLPGDFPEPKRKHR